MTSYIWVIFWNWALKCAKSANLPNNRIKKTDIPNNIRIRVPMKVWMLFICHSWTKKVTFWFRSYPYWAIIHNMKIRRVHNIILICMTVPNKIWLITFKQTRLWVSRKKVWKIWIKVCLYILCWYINLHIFNLAQNHASIL